jgi:hypothetical protein
MIASKAHRSPAARVGPGPVAASDATALLPLGFWGAAARLYDKTALGHASAGIAAIALPDMKHRKLPVAATELSN